MINPEHSVANITVDYNGNFARSLNWNQANLDEFARASDLRTRITIKEGAYRPRFVTDTLGDVLIRRHFATPLDIFGRHTSVRRRVTTTTDFKAGEAAIILDHHIISYDVVQRCKGKIDDRLFAKQLNSAVIDGLSNVLAQEKRAQLLSSLSIDGKHLATTGLLVGIIGGISYGFIVLNPFGALFNFLFPPKPMTGDPFIDFLRYASGLSWKFAGVVYDYGLSLIALMQTTLSLIEGVRNLSLAVGKDNYIRSLGDLNPLRHVNNFTMGEIYLVTKGRKIVTLL